MARRFGTRPIAFVGALLLGGAAAGTAVAPDFFALLALRAIAGAGGGLFFSPAIALVSGLHPEGERGVPVGVFSSAYSAGAGLGLFATALLLPDVGWRGALFAGGILILGALGVAALVVSAKEGVPQGSGRARGWPAALRSRAVWAIGFAFMGLEGASLSAGQYFVPYAESVRGWMPAAAGAIGALFVFPSFFGGPIGGWMAERFTNRRTQMVLFTGVPAALLIGVPYFGTALVAGVAVAFAVAYGMVYAMMYILPPYLPGIPAEELSLSIGLFNGMQLAGGAVVAAIVGYAVGAWGYGAAWLALGGLAVVTLPWLVLVPRTGEHAGR